MLEALLHGKLSREQENMEDILTSMVFGAFRREPAFQGLLPFLGKAEEIIGTNPLSQNHNNYTVRYDKYEFWPPWQEFDNVVPCEPDVVIELNADKDRNILVLIEAKYHSGISSTSSEDITITHQIAKEWLHLDREAKKRNCIPWLIYLTNDIGKSDPKKDIDDAQNEINEKYGSDDTNLTISWLSWRTLSELFGQKLENNTQSPALRDISKLAKHLSLVYFGGISVSILPEPQYKFEIDSIKFDWNFHNQHSATWRFINEG